MQNQLEFNDAQIQTSNANENETENSMINNEVELKAKEIKIIML